MKYTKDEVSEYVAEEDIKFIKLAFCDVFGVQKNISIMSGELERAFKYGIAIDGSAIKGFCGGERSDLFLCPDPSTVSVLPWRPEHGRVVRMYCNIINPDGSPFVADTRKILADTVSLAKEKGIDFYFGSEPEFYLFKCDENSLPTKIPYDNASYMDIAPEDKGENVRREICLTLEQMGICPESSHHEEGPGQNEIDFKYSSPLCAADNLLTFRAVVRTIAAKNGLFADFSPKPIEGIPGSGMHINISAKAKDGRDVQGYIIAGLLKYVSEMTLFFNRTENSYKRFGSNKAPRYISWSCENRSQLIRIPAAKGEYKRAELRSPDSLCNPYIAFSLIINAVLDAAENNLTPPEPIDKNLYDLEIDEIAKTKKLPESLKKAKEAALSSEFIRKCLPSEIIKSYI